MADNLETVGNKEKSRGFIGAVMDLMSAIFTPILPCIVGAGILKAVISLLTTLNVLYPGTDLYNILKFISDSAFYFLPFLLAVSAARTFKTNEYLAMILAGVLLYPTFINAYNPEAAKNLYLGNLAIPILNYSSTVIPILLGTYLLSFVYKFFDRVIPKIISMMVVPLFTILIVAPLTLAFIGPIGSYISKYIGISVNWLFQNASPLAGFIFAFFMPVIVMMGLHYAFYTKAMGNFSKLGNEVMLIPLNVISCAALAGATFAVYFKTEDEEMKATSLSAAVSAVLGVTEPAIYGVTLKLRRPFYIAMTASGIGGAILSTFAMPSYGLKSSIEIPFWNSKIAGAIIFVVSIILAFVLGLVITLLFGNVNEKKTESNK